MDNPASVLCVYSRHSEQCKKILEKIQNYGLDFIVPVSVDNAIARKFLASRIKYVPCLILQYSTHTETYEGDKAFAWINEIIAAKLEEALQTEKETVQSQLETLQKQIELKIEEKYREEYEKRLQTPEEPAIMSGARTKVGKSKGTFIGDLVDLEQLDDEEPELPERAPPPTAQNMSAKKSQDLLSRAREMEKSREDSSRKKGPPSMMQR
jgi:hypothetical protein